MTSTARGLRQAGGGSSEALSVSGAVAQAKGALESIVVRVVGEVSELSNKPGYKAVYFTIKDDKASLPCMMWNNRYQAAGVELRVGSLVEVTGRFTVWAPKGRMNFDVFSVSLSGEGELRLRVAQLARRLQAEGLMDPDRKRAVPAYPATVGVVTSPRGAAVHDVLRTLRRRFPVARVLLAGVPVEGEGAPAGIAEGLARVCAAGAEVVLVVRGGGSFEDLMPFNDESLARAIAAAPVPVVTGIGHEPDTTIADMVSDLRASTPTAAAEAASPARDALASAFSMRSSAMAGSVARTLERAWGAVRRIAERPVLESPEALLANEAQALDFAAMRLARAIPAGVTRDAARLESARARVFAAMPRLLAHEKAACDRAASAFRRVGSAVGAPFDAALRLSASRLHDLSPLAVLARGYAIARSEDGSVVKSVGAVSRGDRLDVAVGDGAIACRVEETEAARAALVEWGERS